MLCLIAEEEEVFMVLDKDNYNSPWRKGTDIADIVGYEYIK